MNNKSSTSSEEEGSSTGDDERTSVELDLQSEVIKLTEELSEARNKIAKLEKDINISNGKLKYSVEKTATIDLLLEEKRELEYCLGEVQEKQETQRNAGHKNGRLHGIGVNEKEIEQYEMKLLKINQLMSSVKDENERLVRENDELRKVNGFVDITFNEDGLNMDDMKLTDSTQIAKARAISKEKMITRIFSQVQEANFAREILEKDLAAAKKSNYIMSKEIERMQRDQETQDIFKTSVQKSLEVSKKHISTLQNDLQKTRLELIEMKHNQSCAILEKSQMQSQLKTSRLRLREASDTISRKESRLLECKQMIEDYQANITTLREELLTRSETANVYENLPIDSDQSEEVIKKLLAAKDDRLFMLTNEYMESKIALQVECGRSKLLENEMALVERDLKESRDENSLMFKEMDVIKDDLRNSELQLLISRNNLKESETSSRLLQCEMHELKVAMTAAEDRYKGHILAREKMHSRMIDRQAEANGIIMRQEREIIDANLHCEELEHKVHQVETAKARIEKDLVSCHQRIGDLLRSDVTSDDSLNTADKCGNSSDIESLSSMSLQLDMLKNSNKVLAQKMEEATSSLNQTRNALTEERRQHLEATTKIEILERETEELGKNIDSLNSLCQNYVTAMKAKENIIGELRNNLFHARKELESDTNSRNKLSASLKEEQNKLMYSENENSVLKNENNSLRSSKIEIINACKSRINDLEVIALQTSEDLSNEKLAKKKIGRERLSLLRLNRDLKAKLSAENGSAEGRDVLLAKAEEIANDGYSEGSEDCFQMQIQLDQVSNELSSLRITHSNETSSLSEENARLRKVLAEKNDSLANTHSIIESLNEELMVLHQSFNHFASNSEQVEILSAAHKKTNDELWGEQQQLLHDALSSHAAERTAGDLLQEQYDRWLAAKIRADSSSNNRTTSNMNIFTEDDKRLSELETENCRLKRELAREKGSREATESLLASLSENTTPQVEKKIRELRTELNRYKEDNAKVSKELTLTKKTLESTQAENTISRNLISQLKAKVTRAEEYVNVSSLAGNAAQVEVAMKLELESIRIERDKLKREVDRLKSITKSNEGDTNGNELESQLKSPQENEQILKIKLDNANKRLEEKEANLVASKKEIAECTNQLTQFQNENIRLNKNMEKLDTEFRSALVKLDNVEQAASADKEMKRQALLSIEELTAQLKLEKDVKDKLLIEREQFTSTLEKKDVQIKQLQKAREEHLRRNGITSRLLQDSQSKEKNLEEEVKRLKSICR